MLLFRGNMANKLKKTAVIREDDERNCPFGLPITDGCCNVGKLIDNMAAINNIKDKEEKATVKHSNNRIFMFERPGDDIKGNNKCKYANYIFDEEKGENKVECNFGDTAAGVGHLNVNPGPLVNTYLGVGYNSQYYTVPYNTDFEGVNRYYYASMDEDNINKIAEDDDEED